MAIHFQRYRDSEAAALNLRHNLKSRGLRPQGRGFFIPYRQLVRAEEVKSLDRRIYGEKVPTEKVNLGHLRIGIRKPDLQTLKRPHLV